MRWELHQVSHRSDDSVGQPTFAQPLFVPKRKCFNKSFPRFGRRVHRGIPGEGVCDSPFDGPSLPGQASSVGHAFFPQDGRVHFDEDETFIDVSGDGVRLLPVTVHEFGHALGLDHSQEESAIMYPIYSEHRTSPQQDDIAGIQSIYGEHDYVNWSIHTLSLSPCCLPSYVLCI